MPHRVLVVDDEEAIRSLVKDYLEGRGFHVLTASDGDEGIKVFKNEKPQLVLIDFLLPRKNGFAVAEAIRKDEGRADTPIIMMSGVFKNPKTAVEAREKYRVVDFLSKPLDMTRVEALITQTLGDSAEAGTPAPVPARAPTRSFSDRPERSSGDIFQSGDVGSMANVLSQSESPAPRGASHHPARPSGGPPAVKKPAAPSAPVVDHGSGVFNGRPFPEIPDEGDLEQMPVAMLLSVIRYDQVTGMLDLTDQGTHRRIYIVNGLPTFMQSNAEGENVGALLLRRGRITEPDFQRCLTYMKAKGRTLQQSLLELRLANETDLSTAYKLLAGQLLPLALGMASGRFKWRETDAFIGRVPEGNFEPMSVLFDGIKRHVHPPQILKFFKGREDVPMMRTVQFDALMPFFRRAFSATNVASEIQGRVTYRELSRRHQNQASIVTPQLFALVTSGMVALPELSDDNAMDVAVNAAAAQIQDMHDRLEFEDDERGAPAGPQFDDDEDTGSLKPEEKKAVASIARFHDEIMSKDFFQIFNANKDTDLEKVKAAYFELAKRWHTDAYADMKLGSARVKLDAIFSRITEAYETITDKGKREEYLVYIDRQKKGLPTDVNQILKGEQLFDQAQAMVRRRDYPGAKNVLEEAVRLNPGDALYYAHLGWVTFNVNPKAQNAVVDAVNYLKRAVKEQENCAVAYQYLGQIAFSRGQQNEARKWWLQCLEWEPNNIEAARGLRMLNTREEKDKQSKSSLLGKLLKK
jgi:CheY-like chemotaxis protein/tetratricopeptide (TPR) repeat protein